MISRTVDRILPIPFCHITFAGLLSPHHFVSVRFSISTCSDQVDSAVGRHATVFIVQHSRQNPEHAEKCHTDISAIYRMRVCMRGMLLKTHWPMVCCGVLLGTHLSSCLPGRAGCPNHRIILSVCMRKAFPSACLYPDDLQDQSRAGP